VVATPVFQGSTIVPLTGTGGFSLGDVIRINPGQATAESHVIVGFSSLVVWPALKHNHGAGEPIVELGPTIDSDADGCSDATELILSPEYGGVRDPDDFWDFFDVTGDAAIDIVDALSVLTYFGDPGVSAPANLRDRSIPDPQQPWRTGEEDDGVDVADVVNNLQSFGHACAS
jgi:hypothetical protein